jgi:transcriptional regulator with XRE-family HTH domain
MQAEVLRFFRSAKNLPQKAIADVLGKSQPYYSDLENGINKLGLDDAEKLAVFYGVSAAIFTNDKQPILNNNIGEHSKGIGVIAEHYNEAGKELVQPLLEKIDTLLNLLAEEKKVLAQERKELLVVFNKLADKLTN